MAKGTLKPEVKANIEEQLEELVVVQDYLSKNSQDDQITAIERRSEFVLLDGGIKVPKILIIKNASGVTQILNTFSTEFTEEKIDELSNKTGLNVDDISALIKDGMELEEIKDAADSLPFKDIAESAAIREMIRQGITPERLSEMKSKGVSVEVLQNGGIKREVLTKIAEVDSEGQMNFDEEWFEKNLRPFAELGVIDESENLVVKDKKEGNDSLEVVPLDKKREEKTKEQLQKAKVAKTFGIDEDEILSIIRIEDRIGGSKLFNYEMTGVERPLIVRLRDNKFRVVKEGKDGEMKEMIGIEATPVSKQVAILLKNTPGAYTTLRDGEVKAGKTNPNQVEYNIFQIKRAGESVDDDLNNLLFVGCCGKTDMNIIESRDNGEVRFAKPPQTSIYPESIYLENNNGTNQKREISGPASEPHNQYISMEDIEERKETLQKLLEVEEKIERIENPEDYHLAEENDSSEGTQKSELSELYSERSKLLKELELKESELVKDEQEYEHTMRLRRQS